MKNIVKTKALIFILLLIIICFLGCNGLIQENPSIRISWSDDLGQLIFNNNVKSISPYHETVPPSKINIDFQLNSQAVNEGWMMDGWDIFFTKSMYLTVAHSSGILPTRGTARFPTKTYAKDIKPLFLKNDD